MFFSMSLLVLAAPASAFLGALAVGLSVISTVANIGSGVANGKASKAAANARANEYAALLSSVQALQPIVDQILQDVGALRAQVDLLPSEIIFLDRYEEATVLVEVGVGYANDLLLIENYENANFVSSRFELLAEITSEMEGKIVFFRDAALDGNSLAVAQLALLQEAMIISYHAQAVYSIRDEDRFNAAILDQFDCSQFDDIPEEIRGDVSCSIGHAARRNDQGTAYYNALREKLTEMSLIWTSLATVSYQQVLSSDLPRHVASFRDGGVTFGDLQSGQYQPSSGLLGRYDATPEDVAGDISFMMTNLTSLEGATSERRELVCAVVIPWIEKNRTVYDDGVEYFYPVPQGAFAYLEEMTVTSEIDIVEGQVAIRERINISPDSIEPTFNHLGAFELPTYSRFQYGVSGVSGNIQEPDILRMDYQFGQYFMVPDIFDLPECLSRSDSVFVSWVESSEEIQWSGGSMQEVNAAEYDQFVRGSYSRERIYSSEFSQVVLSGNAQNEGAAITLVNEILHATNYTLSIDLANNLQAEIR